jgi:hypothetical protein
MARTARSIGYAGSGYIGSKRLPLQREVDVVWRMRSNRIPRIVSAQPIAETGPAKSAKADQQKR